jgi:hypothetical protein
LSASDVDVAGHYLVEHVVGQAIAIDGFAHSVGMEAGFERGAAEERQLGEGDAFNGE